MKWTIKKFFEGRSEEYGLFNYIRQYIESLGPVKVEASKTQVSFGTNRKFAWVWFPPAWAKRPKNCVVLTFKLDHLVKHKQVVKVAEPYPGRFTHHVIISNEKEFTSDVRKWLKDAYSKA